jgi:hypothetical protein
MSLVSRQGWRLSSVAIAIAAIVPGLLAAERASAAKKPDPGFLSVSAPSSAEGSVPFSIRTDGEADRLRATLNGRGVTRVLRPDAGSHRRGRLAADNGLHFGANTLRVRAARDDGTFDVETRTIVVERDRPLAGAGKDRRTKDGLPVTLDGRESAAARGGDLRFRWRLLAAPRGSKAKPDRPRSARSQFDPDLPGLYRLKLTVTESGMSGAGATDSDIILIEPIANYPPIGAPVDTMRRDQGGAVGIQVGPDFFPLGDGNVQAVVLDRTTLAVQTQVSLGGSPSDANRLKGMIAKADNELVIVSNPRGGISSAFGAVVKQLGGAKIPNASSGTPGWSIVGIPGSTGGYYANRGMNTASFGGGARGRLIGYLQNYDSSGLQQQFAFTSGQYVPIDTSAPGGPAGRNVIQVGSDQYVSDPLPACATGGFQLLVLGAESLDPIDSAFNRAYATNGCGSTPDGATQLELSYILEAVKNDAGSALVVIQSIGDPVDRSTGDWPSLTDSISTVGATGSVFGCLGASAGSPQGCPASKASPSYSLIGSVGVSSFPLNEASSSLTGVGPARLRGVLQPNRQGGFAPQLVSPVAAGSATNLRLTEIAYQQPTSWPYTDTAEGRNALAYIATTLNLVPDPKNPGASCYVPAQPDVRSQYCNVESVSNAEGPLNDLRDACPAQQLGSTFCANDWKKLIDQLESEFDWVGNVGNLVAALQEPLNDNAIGIQAYLTSVGDQIKRSIAPPPVSAGVDWWSIVSSILFAASYFGGEELGPALGVVASAINIGEDLDVDSDGSPNEGKFKVAVDDLAETLAGNFETQVTLLAHVGDLLVSDYGKLQAVGGNPAEFGFSGDQLNVTLDTLRLGNAQTIWSTLLPAAYPPNLYAPGKTNPNPAKLGQYQCWYLDQDPNNPVEYIPTQYHPFPAPNPNAALLLPPPEGGIIAMSKAGSPLPGGKIYSPRRPPMPPKSLTKNLFKPATFDGNGNPIGLGFFKPWFFANLPQGKTTKCSKVG